MKRIAILQSAYIPWKGYFDCVKSVDEFVLYDDAQYTRRDWRNRNLIVTPTRPKWLTIPVQVKGRFKQKINETQIADPAWSKRHWKTLSMNYGASPFFKKYRDVLEPLYRDCQETRLSAVNVRFLAAICGLLGIATPLVSSSRYQLTGTATENLLGICLQAGASVYVSGPAARAYLDEAAFTRAGIAVEWMDYAGYPPYRQLHGGFRHEVSILDLLFNEGEEAPAFMKPFSAVVPVA